MRGMIMSMISRSGQAVSSRRERLVAVPGRDDVVAVRAQLVGEEDEEVRVVVDDQDARRVPPPKPSCRCAVSMARG